MRRTLALSAIASIGLLCSAGLLMAADATDWHSITPKTDAELEKLFDQPLEGLETPAKKECYVYRSELTPAIVFRSKAPTMRLFDRMADFGLDGPTQVAYVTAGQIKVMGRGELAGPMEESWLLVWFSGGKGWDRIKHSAYAQNNIKDDKTYAFDVPFLISLQHKASKISIGSAGVELTFPGEAGAVQVMPLLGVNRPQPAETAKWAAALPADIAQQARQWNARLKFYPAQVKETYSIDTAKGVVSLIHNFRFVEIKDDWNTKGTMDAPIAPSISLASQHGFPVKFSSATVDTKCPTHFGPLWVAPNSKTVQIDVPGILDLVTKVMVPNVDPAKDADLLAEIDKQLLGRAQATGMGWWAAAGCAMEQGSKAALIPYATPKTVETIKAATMRLVHENVFAGEQTRDTIIDARRGRVYLVDYANHNQRFAGDDESPACEIPRGLFNYAFYTGDWETVRNKWADLQAAGVGSYVKNNWIVQSRLNSGGDTYHDVIVGTCHMARMAAVLGEEKDFGFFSYLLTRHLLAYYGFEYAELAHARQYQPWFITLTDADMLVWDIYGPFGGMFTPYDKGGFYGPYSGFYEHYYRMDNDIMPRYYKAFLAKHAEHIFGEIVTQKVPNPEAGKDESKWALLFQLRAHFLDWDADKLRAWTEGSGWSGKKSAEALTVLYDRKHPRQAVEILNPKLKKTVTGSGIQLQSDGLKHQNLDVDAETLREPALFWFGFNAQGAPLKGAHNGNALTLGAMSIGEGKVVQRENQTPNWVSAWYGFNVSRPTDASKAAATEQAKAKWLIMGPFGGADTQKEDWAKAFPPEAVTEADLTKTYPGLIRAKDDDGGKAGTVVQVKWQPREMKGMEDGKPLPDYTLACRWGFNHFGYTYCFTKVYAPAGAKAKFGISSCGGQKVWINGQLAFEKASDARRLKEDDRMFDGQLKPGWNMILVKLKNVEFWEKMYFRIMDENEQAIPGLKFDPQGK